MRLPTVAGVIVATSIAARAATVSPTARMVQAAAVVAEARAIPDEGIPQSLWDRAQCVAVFPALKKAAFVLGGEYGIGVMSCRSEQRWSAPIFMELQKGSWGFQAGAESVDLVLLVMNATGRDRLLDNTVALGADASVAAGPLGRNAQALTDTALKAEILSYSRAMGLFAGIDISGGVIKTNVEGNRGLYGKEVTPRAVLMGRAESAPSAARPFLDALRAHVK